METSSKNLHRQAIIIIYMRTDINGKFMSSCEALAIVERVIYKKIMEDKR